MLTTAALAELARTLSGQHVLSVYIDGATNDPATRNAWRTQLEAGLASLRRTVHARSADEARELGRCIERLMAVLGTSPASPGAPGWVAFITEEQVVRAEALPVTMPDLVRWSDGPWVSPYLRAEKELRPAIVAVVDRRSAAIYQYVLGTLTRIDALRAHAHVQPAYHMGRGPGRQFHSGTRGATGHDEAAKVLRVGTERMLREAVDRLVHASGQDGWILIGGTPQAAQTTVRMLPEGAASRAVWLRRIGHGASEAEIHRSAADGAVYLRRRLDGTLVDAALDRAARAAGRGAVGEEATRATLRLGAVQTLLISLAFLQHSPDTAEELVRAALAERAQIEVVSGAAAMRLDTDHGGVAALLRYASPGMTAEARSANG